MRGTRAERPFMALVSAANSNVIRRSLGSILPFAPTNENNGYECFWCTLIVTSTVFMAAIMV